VRVIATLLVALVAGLLAAGCTPDRSSPSTAPSSVPSVPSGPSLTGRLTLTPSVPPSSGPSRPGASKPHPSAAPTLRITSPHSGESLHLPATVRYETSAAPSDAVIRIYSGTSPAGGHLDFVLSSLRGSITLPDDKTLTGYRNLTFCLAAGDRLIGDACQTLHLALIGRK